jgi:DNA helicase-2/ATP-dependent DNA helicase PcrA
MTVQATGPWAELNDEQRAAVEHADAGGPAQPLLVIAGAGSGKTATLAWRVARLVRDGADPQRVLLMTFSRRAATDLARRAGAMLARIAALDAPPTWPWSGTFHSVGARLLREYAPRIGLARSFTVHDRADSEDLIALVRHDLALDTTRARFPGKSTCIAIYSRVVNAGASLDDVLARWFPWCVPWERDLRRLFDAYVGAKQAHGVLDYDDLLLYWSQMVDEPALAREIGGRFDHVLVDEYQDTNALQAAILRAMKPDGRGVTAVGDDAQSIYSFRAATVRNILDFPRRFTQPARVLMLERNYRSTRPILDAANAVIALARERYAKNLWTDRAAGAKPRLVSVRDRAEQARYVAERVLAQAEEGAPLKSQAVLFRSSSHSAELELELARRAIPFVKYGGLRFLEGAHVKDVLAVLRFAENARGRIAAFRALKLLPGVGPASAGRLLDALDAASDPIPVLDAFAPPPAADGDWPAFAALFGRLRRGDAGWPVEVDAVCRWYEPHLARLYDDAAVRRNDLAQLAQIASTYASRERFLTELALDPPAATSDEAGAPGRDDDYLILSTIHSAKGQEWRSVHVLNVVDGCIPSDLATGAADEIEEERRLLYVAMTRARDTLHLIVPQAFHVSGQTACGDRHVYASRSRFLPRSLDPLFDLIAWPPAGESPVPVVAEPAPTVDVGARVRALWR